ncbi:type IV secretory system conjugative DNA transfer family protein [Blautia luti]|uniref:type IV secretory system conjugative DNA transfer family protein n=1 Tax=Blautia luti TaxID=89014 RepID=UPI0018AA56EA|nr:type IV secretion system DNA-binding domain-containing protein [Blautia luti]
MTYNFGQKRIGTGSNQKINNGMYTKTILGQSIEDTPVPVWTADRSRNPFVAFQNPKTQKIFGINKDMLAYGLIAIGAPGTGKTNFLNMTLDRMLATMQPTDIIIIFDTKGDYLETFGSRIPDSDKIVIGNCEAYRRVTFYHNIFAEVMPRGKDGKLVYTPESDEDALNLCEQLFQSMNSETQPIFPTMAEQVVAAVMVYFMRTYWRKDQSKLNNKEFINFFTHSTNDDLKKVFELEYMSDQHSCIDYISGKGNQTQGVNSYVGSVLKKMFVGPFAQADPAREFSMRDIIYSGKKKVVFIEYDLCKGKLLAPMYGLLIDRAFANALGGRQKTKTNKYFLLDEMLLLPKIEHMCDSLNFGRSLGVKVMCGLQNICGLEEQYGEAGAKNILSSFQNMIAFRTNDYDTRQFVINRLGENYQNFSLSVQQENLNLQREGHTVEDWNLLKLKNGEAVVSLAGEESFLFTMPLYR